MPRIRQFRDVRITPSALYYIHVCMDEGFIHLQNPKCLLPLDEELQEEIEKGVFHDSVIGRNCECRRPHSRKRGLLVLEIRRQYRSQRNYLKLPAAAARSNVIQVPQIQYSMRQEVIEQCPRSEGRAIPVSTTTVTVGPWMLQY